MHEHKEGAPVDLEALGFDLWEDEELPFDFNVPPPCFARIYVMQVPVTVAVDRNYRLWVAEDHIDLIPFGLAEIDLMAVEVVLYLPRS